MRTWDDSTPRGPGNNRSDLTEIMETPDVPTYIVFGYGSLIFKANCRNGFIFICSDLGIPSPRPM